MTLKASFSSVESLSDDVRVVSDSERFPTLTLLQSRGMFLPIKQAIPLDIVDAQGNTESLILEFSNRYMNVQWQHFALTQVHRNILDVLCSCMQPIYRPDGVLFEFSLYELYSFLVPETKRKTSSKTRFHLAHAEDLRNRLAELKMARFRVEDLATQKVYTGRIGLSTEGENTSERYGQARERFRMSLRFTEFWIDDVHVDLQQVLHRVLALANPVSQALARWVLSNKFKSGELLTDELKELGAIYTGMSRSGISNVVRQIKDDTDGLASLGIQFRKTSTGGLGVFYEKLATVRWQNGKHNRVQMPLPAMPEGFVPAPLEGRVVSREFFKRALRREK